MPPDLGLVVDAAEGDADELSAERPRDRLTQRRLADARRPDQRQDGSGAPTAVRGGQPSLRAKLPHGQVLDDAILHVVQPGMILVEDGPRGS